MFDLGWSEMAVIALVALVVLGPKELPQAMKTFAAFTRKMQRYARDFRSGVDGIIREAELEDAKKALDSVRVNPKAMLKNVIDPTGEATAAVTEVESAAKDKGAPAAGATTPSPSPTLSPPALAPPSAAAATAATPVPAPAPEPAPQELSKVIVQPTNMAPPHSVRPPAPQAQAAPQPAATQASAKPDERAPPGGDDA